jgi:Probable lipid transfer
MFLFNINNVDNKYNKIKTQIATTQPSSTRSIYVFPLTTQSLQLSNCISTIKFDTRNFKLFCNMALLSFPKFTFIIVLLSYLMISNNMVFAISFCRMNDEGIKACLPAARGSHPPAPTPQCCSYAKVADVRCFCSYQHSYLVRLFGINVSQVKKIPMMCGIKRPSYC